MRTRVPVRNHRPEWEAPLQLGVEWLLRRADIDHEVLTHCGWAVYAVEASRGRCRYGSRTITVPTWALASKRPLFADYYTAHELAHAFAWMHDREGQHGPAFMQWLKRLCPREAWHYELEYKPRNAMAAGIRKPRGWV